MALCQLELMTSHQRNHSCLILILEIKGKYFQIKKVYSMNDCRHISASALLAHWDRMGVVDAEEVLADLGVRDMEEGNIVEQLDTWCREQLMLGVEMIR